MPTSYSAPRGKRTTYHCKAKGHELIDGNSMNICRPMRLGDFLANKDLQVKNSTALSLWKAWEKFENSGSHLSKQYDLSFFMNYSSTYLWKSVPDATGSYDSDNRTSRLGYVPQVPCRCTAAAAPRAKRACAIPHALGTVACRLGFSINFLTKPVDALASRVQSLRTPRGEKAINRATSDNFEDVRMK